MAQKRKKKPVRRSRPRYEFKPDATGSSFLKQLHLTQHQQRQLLRWALFALVCVLGLVLQDVILCHMSILGATTDLVPMAILLISVTIGSHQGSIFAFIASLIYQFSGSAPGPYVIAYLSFLGIAGGMFREGFWRRGFASDVLCAAIMLLAYELAVFGTGIFMGLTTWYRLGVFLVTAIISILIMIALYPLISKIDRIGGETWKE